MCLLAQIFVQLRKILIAKYKKNSENGLSVIGVISGERWIWINRKEKRIAKKPQNKAVEMQILQKNKTAATCFDAYF